MNSKKAKVIRKLVRELASPGVNTAEVIPTLKKAFNELTHKEKKKSKLFSASTG